ncbi:MAG: RNA-binding protein [Saprospiraceae bacterium]|nr:RNA-binding protein [Saprospiraceae bacterium]MCB9317807.1 RNA-binding protein [Lewinellaceae bacterium]
MNIFVGKLNYATSEDELRQAFEAYGSVSSCKIIMDRFTGRSKGFAFVEMDDNAEATAAIEALNNTLLGGRAIVVNKARPREDRF